MKIPFLHLVSESAVWYFSLIQNQRVKQHIGIKIATETETKCSPIPKCHTSLTIPFLIAHNQTPILTPNGDWQGWWCFVCMRQKIGLSVWNSRNQNAYPFFCIYFEKCCCDIRWKRWKGEERSLCVPFFNCVSSVVNITIPINNLLRGLRFCFTLMLLQPFLHPKNQIFSKPI